MKILKKRKLRRWWRRERNFEDNHYIFNQLSLIMQCVGTLIDNVVQLNIMGKEKNVGRRTIIFFYSDIDKFL